MFGFKEVDADTLTSWMSSGEAVVIDVRSPAEAARGMIGGADLMPLHTIPLKIDEIKERGAKVIFYCQSGARSAQACAFMAQQGLDEVYNLSGGIMGWARSGKALAQPK